MIKSMTGYGASKKLIKGGFIRVEIRTLNHRYLDIVCRIPESCLVFENQIKSLIKKVIKRGRVNLSLNLETQDKKLPQINIDFNLAGKYYDLLKNLQRKLRLTSSISLEQIISFPQVLIFEEKKEDLNKYWADIKKAVNLALKQLISFRCAEGRIIYRDLRNRIFDINKIIKRAEKKLPQIIERYRKKIEKRIKSFAKVTDRNRIETEVAIFSQNADISEEITRIKGHLNEFLKSLSVNNEVGKKLDFIAQEIYREANTISAKANDYSISEEALEVKNQVEKIREQLQNIE
jgi:uncharacterized protein (TIGR00255 family)